MLEFCRNKIEVFLQLQIMIEFDVLSQFEFLCALSDELDFVTSAVTVLSSQFTAKNARETARRVREEKQN